LERIGEAVVGCDHGRKGETGMRRCRDNLVRSSHEPTRNPVPHFLLPPSYHNRSRGCQLAHRRSERVLKAPMPLPKWAPLVWSVNASRVAGPKGHLRSQGQEACFQQHFEANSVGQEPTCCGPCESIELQSSRGWLTGVTPCSCAERGALGKFSTGT
jgi:hypothetical protein